MDVQLGNRTGFSYVFDDVREINNLKKNPVRRSQKLQPKWSNIQASYYPRQVNMQETC